MIIANTVFLLQHLFFLLPVCTSENSSCIFSAFGFAWVKEIPVLKTTFKKFFRQTICHPIRLSRVVF